MLLWHYMPIDVYNQTLAISKPYVCDISKSEIMNSSDLDAVTFKDAYDWLVDKMNEKIDNPDNIAYPVWGWHTFDGKHKKPDLRNNYFKNRKIPMILVEIDIPEQQVLLSDEEKWCYSCLNNMPYFETDKEFNRYDELTDTEKNTVRKKSWNKIFDTKTSDYIQACFWQLKPEYVRAIYFNIKDSKHLQHNSWQLKPEHIKELQKTK